MTPFSVAPSPRGRSVCRWGCRLVVRFPARIRLELVVGGLEMPLEQRHLSAQGFALRMAWTARVVLTVTSSAPSATSIAAILGR